MCCQKGPCEDTEGWAYASTYTCWEFERRQICTRGEFGEGYRWLARWEYYFNNPSSNCCVCGKTRWMTLRRRAEPLAVHFEADILPAVPTAPPAV